MAEVADVVKLTGFAHLDATSDQAAPREIDVRQGDADFPIEIVFTGLIDRIAKALVRSVSQLQFRPLTETQILRQVR